jgi:D-amino-acid oxidase
MTIPQPAFARRDLLRAAALASAPLLLPGCATVVRREPLPAAAQGCLPPVHVSENRIIRTVAGLRPYRPAGFVVREEQVGGTRIVHNYGHGGAEITLSWGCSKLAMDLGLQGHSGPVAVIGAGVMGLTTARLVQEAGFPVTLYAAALPPDTTSSIAGGQWSPYGHYRESEVTLEWRTQFRAAADYSWRRFQLMAGEQYGVRWLPTYNETNGSLGPPLLPDFPRSARMLEQGEHPFPVANLSRYETLYVEMGRFLPRLLEDILRAGGHIVVRSFVSPIEIDALPENLVMNCTGLGARHLFGDEGLRPARGQLVVLRPQPEVRYAFTGRAGYMFPHSDGIILGGTFEPDNWDTRADPITAARILRSHQEIFGNLRCQSSAERGLRPNDRGFDDSLAAVPWGAWG